MSATAGLFARRIELKKFASAHRVGLCNKFGKAVMPRGVIATARMQWGHLKRKYTQDLGIFFPGS